METDSCPLKCLSRDLLTNIMARLDGSSLVAVACTCSDLRDAARDQSLWRRLCHKTWPSTALEEAELLFSSSKIGAFDKLYADSRSVALHLRPLHASSFKPHGRPDLETYVSPSDFASLVDIYYKQKCIMSRVLQKIPDAMDMYIDNRTQSYADVDLSIWQSWFTSCPFKVDLLSSQCYDYGSYDMELDYMSDYEGQDYEDEDRVAFSAEGITRRKDYCQELMKDLRLSWVLVDKKKGKAVNLSSWKPLSVQRSWPSYDSYLIQFGCIMQLEERVLPHKLAKCVIMAKCRVTDTKPCPTWREISMMVEDILGARMDGSKSLMVLSQAACGLRSTKYREIKLGFAHCEKQRRDMIRRREIKEKLADTMCVLIEITVFLVFCYYFILNV